jgi:heterodisulfide reductase subunit C
MSDEGTTEGRTTLAGGIAAFCGVNVFLCYQCGRCSAGCPAALAMDVLPHQVIHLVKLGCVEELLRSHSIWMCAGCQTCTARCPNGIDVAGVMDALRQVLPLDRFSPAGRRIAAFHRMFLSQVVRRGRVYELGLVARYQLVRRPSWAEIFVGVQMIRKRKFRWLPRRISLAKAGERFPEKRSGKPSPDCWKSPLVRLVDKSEQGP